MATQSGSDNRESIIESYFAAFNAIQKGDERAVDRMMDLWHESGHCQVVGAGKLPDEYRGLNAVRALYKGIARAPRQEIHTERGRTRATKEDVVVEWTSQIGIDPKPLKVDGSNAFSFKDNRISDLKIVLSPKGATGQQLKLHELEVSDIGRLALAAWAVV